MCAADIARLKDEELKAKVKVQALELQAKEKEIEEMRKTMEELRASAGGGASKKEKLNDLA